MRTQFLQIKTPKNQLWSIYLPRLALCSWPWGPNLPFVGHKVQSQIKKSTYLSPNYTVAAIFLKIRAQSFPQVVFKMTK